MDEPDPAVSLPLAHAHATDDPATETVAGDFEALGENVAASQDSANPIPNDTSVDNSSPPGHDLGAELANDSNDYVTVTKNEASEETTSPPDLTVPADPAAAAADAISLEAPSTSSSLEAPLSSSLEAAADTTTTTTTAAALTAHLLPAENGPLDGPLPASPKSSAGESLPARSKPQPPSAQPAAATAMRTGPSRRPGARAVLQPPSVTQKSPAKQGSVQPAAGSAASIPRSKTPPTSTVNNVAEPLRPMSPQSPLPAISSPLPSPSPSPALPVGVSRDVVASLPAVQPQQTLAESYILPVRDLRVAKVCRSLSTVLADSAWGATFDGQEGRPGMPRRISTFGGGVASTRPILPVANGKGGTLVGSSGLALKDVAMVLGPPVYSFTAVRPGAAPAEHAVTHDWIENRIEATTAIDALGVTTDWLRGKVRSGLEEEALQRLNRESDRDMVRSMHVPPREKYSIHKLGDGRPSSKRHVSLASSVELTGYRGRPTSSSRRLSVGRPTSSRSIYGRDSFSSMPGGGGKRPDSSASMLSNAGGMGGTYQGGRRPESSTSALSASNVGKLGGDAKRPESAYSVQSLSNLLGGNLGGRRPDSSTSMLSFSNTAMFDSSMRPRSPIVVRMNFDEMLALVRQFVSDNQWRLHDIFGRTAQVDNYRMPIGEVCDLLCLASGVVALSDEQRRSLAFAMAAGIKGTLLPLSRAQLLSTLTRLLCPDVHGIVDYRALLDDHAGRSQLETRLRSEKMRRRRRSSGNGIAPEEPTLHHAIARAMAETGNSLAWIGEAEFKAPRFSSVSSVASSQGVAPKDADDGEGEGRRRRSSLNGSFSSLDDAHGLSNFIQHRLSRVTETGSLASSSMSLNLTPGHEATTMAANGPRRRSSVGAMANVAEEEKPKALPRRSSLTVEPNFVPFARRRRSESLAAVVDQAAPKVPAQGTVGALKKASPPKSTATSIKSDQESVPTGAPRPRLSTMEFPVSVTPDFLARIQQHEREVCDATEKALARLGGTHLTRRQLERVLITPADRVVPRPGVGWPVLNK